MERHTAASLLQWLGEKPRSLGWNAIIAYDRSHANTALIQEYISRFDATSYLRPITARVAMSEEEAQYLYGLTLDCPRLTFENATVKWSLARLRVRVVGGTQLTTRKPPGGFDQVVKVSSYDAVNGPDITMGLTLAVLLGSVDVQGRVVIDLSKGTEIDVNFADSRDHRRIGGEFFRAYFEGLPDEQKVFVLSEIASPEGQILKPRNVQIRTHAPPGADLPASPEYGLGAVLMFLTMEGEDYGTFPESDADLPYLIPVDDGANLSSAMLVGNDLLMRTFIEEGCRRITQDPDAFAYQTHTGPSGFVEGLSVTRGERTGAALNTALPDFPSLSCSGLRTPLASQGPNQASFDVRIEQDALVMDWQGFVDQPLTLRTAQNTTHAKAVRLSWKWQGTIALRVDAESGALRWAAVPEAELMQCKAAPLEFADIPEVADHFGEVADYLESRLAMHLRDSAADFVGPLEELDLLRLNSILFRDRYLFEPVEGHLPGDLFVTGRIAPQAGAFVVSPVEPMVGPGETLQLTTVPALSGISWTVQSIVGSSKDAGAIDASTGLYTAPAAQDIQGTFSRVRVTATHEERSSSALITVVLRDVTFNPLVVVCGAGMKTEMSAAARDGSQLQWSLGGQVPGSQIVPSVEPGGDHTYIAPQPSTGSQPAFSLDEVHVQRPGDANRYTSYVLVVHRPATATISIRPDADLPEGSVRLVADLGEGVIESGATWTLLAGSGRLDAQEGVYSVDPAGQHRFALITVTIEAPLPGFPAYHGYFILALPLTMALAQHYSAGVSS